MLQERLKKNKSWLIGASILLTYQLSICQSSSVKTPTFQYSCLVRLPLFLLLFILQTWKPLDIGIFINLHFYTFSTPPHPVVLVSKWCVPLIIFHQRRWRQRDIVLSMSVRQSIRPSICPSEQTNWYLGG